jgi:hypothetical protein
MKAPQSDSAISETQPVQSIENLVTGCEMDKDQDIRQALRQFGEARDEFRQAHKYGTEALSRGDFEAVLEAIAAESGAIAKQRAATKRLAKPFEPREHVMAHASERDA